ncbi:MAG: ABC transporter ATP-binding protein [Actinomycetota bacterium]|nr:ABC transporter ATP-binding protein [Actinomycetota bacterium]
MTSSTEVATHRVRPAGSVAARAVDVVKVFGAADAAVRALDGVTVDFAAGAFTAIMGPSGSGKSTLLHCVAGLDTPTSGQVFLGDTDLTRMSDKAVTLTRRKRVGFVFQSFNLLPMLSAEQNILLPLRLAGQRPDREWFDGVVDALGLRDRLAHRPGELSGGQLQRVAAARALVTRPDVVVADEPTGSLDRATSAELLGFLARSVRELGQTVVMVTHDPSAAAYADRVVLLADGRLVGEIDSPTTDSVLDAMRGLGA